MFRIALTSFGSCVLSLICGTCLFFALFKTYNRKSITLVPFLLIILTFLLFSYWSNLQDLWIGSKVECGIFDNYHRETNYRGITNQSYIYLKNEPKSVLFNITKSEFEKLEIYENDKICWQKWQSLENTNLNKE